jgi:hypothetical protein
MTKEGGVSGINRQAFKYSTFPPIKNFFVKNPGHLNSQKRFQAAKQLFMCPDQIMWQPASKIRYRCVFFPYRLEMFPHYLAFYSTGIDR